MTGEPQQAEQANPIAEAFARATPVTPLPGTSAPPADPPREETEETPPIEAEGALFPLNDYGNGKRLKLYYGRNIRYVPRLGWLRWDETRWESDEDEIKVRGDAQRIAERIEKEAEELKLPDWQAAHLEAWTAARPRYTKLTRRANKDGLAEEEEKELAKLEELREPGLEASRALGKLRAAHKAHARASGNSGRIKNMLIEATTALTVAPDKLNRNPMHFSCENGVLEFRWIKAPPDPDRGSWREEDLIPEVRVLKHKRRQMITKRARAAYYPAADRTEFNKFLAQILPDPEERAFVKRWFGYSLTGDTSEQKLAFFHGQGRNGKSTLVDTIANIMNDYSTTIPIETLTGSEQRKGSDATPDLVRLPGARFVRASEPEQGQKMKESLIKALTGGEPIMIRRMMQEFVEITPEFKLTISGNYRPEVRGADDGIWRRIMLVEFGQQIPKDKVDRDLPRKLWEERDGILAWMVEGCLDWMEQGLNPPATVLEATRNYRAESDLARTFIESECTITGEREDKVYARDLGDAFNGWLRANGYPVWGQGQTSKQLKKRSETLRGPNGEAFTWGKDSTTCYFGLKLSDQAETWRIEYKNSREEK